MHIKKEIYFKSVFKKNVNTGGGKCVVVFCSVLQFLCRKYSEHGTSRLFSFFKLISGEVLFEGSCSAACIRQ